MLLHKLVNPNLEASAGRMLQAHDNQQVPAMESLLDSIELASPRSLDQATKQALKQFMRVYFSGVQKDEVSDSLPEDLYGAAQSHWQLCQQRDSAGHRLRVFNPEFTQEGWQSTHTVVEIVSEDQPWLVTSVQSVLAVCDVGIHLLIHPIFNIARDDSGRALQITAAHLSDTDVASNAPKKESLIHVQVDRLDDSELKTLHTALDSMLTMLKLTYQEQSAMQQTIATLAKKNDANGEFLNWLKDDKFICYGTAVLRTEKAAGKRQDDALIVIEDPDAQGYLNPNHAYHWPLAEQIPSDALEALNDKDKNLIISKTSIKSPIIRDEFCDILLLKSVDKVSVLVGLFASSVQFQTAQSIPFLRDKIELAIKASERAPDSHDGTALERILRNLPRDMLLQTSTQQLLDMAQGIVALNERRQIRMFHSVDPLNRFYNCLVFIPRDTYSRELRYNIEAILLAGLMGENLDFNTVFSSDTALARLHFVVRRRPPFTHAVDWNLLEQRVQKAAITWHDQLLDTLREKHDENNALTLFKKYSKGFNENYREDYSARAAVADINFIETTDLTKGPVMSFYRHILADSNTVNFKLFSDTQSVSLSNVIPIIENMGLRVEAGHPFEIKRNNHSTIWIHEFTADYASSSAHDASDSGKHVQEAWYRIWRDEVENDGFNQLILGAGLNWREVVILRSYCKYLLQVGVSFSQSYMVECLVANSKISTLLVDYFKERFDPSLTTRNTAVKKQTIVDELESVASLDEERILGGYLNLIDATVRTNTYRQDGHGEPHEYLSFKFDSSMVHDLPLPRPKVEIFVYSPKMEAIHLRGGSVARGGLRWSDRREDFRTEVLGLMKAQMVKNAVIVPVGSKGGFFVKMPASSDRDTNQQNAIACYKTFLRGLLDVTDNIIEGEIIAPTDVVCYDEEDPYLVVAADKGTATFSDYANEVSMEYGFWLGDAFASGGSAGYDHKKMGITAKGAWESVMRHFRELGLNTQTQSITAVGIGDMAGDVFGNGMLLSTEIKLVAAFNHLHIFIDPAPDTSSSYAERARLFDLPGSSWTDYNLDLISKGGGIYSRSDKKIDLSPEAQSALGIEKNTLAPNELISHILKAPVDLLWNGGIGTYIKSTNESHQDAADRSNDQLRIDARELRCKVIGEGGNLGVTQNARIEFARSGGHIYTDAIDNSAGVDCSDHEVNIKILLNAVVQNQDLTLKHRDQLLVEMTSEVSSLVLRDNYLQTQCINLIMSESAKYFDEHAQFMTHLETAGKLDRNIEFLPDTDEVADRLANAEGLSAPEIAVLVSYSKLVMYDDLLASELSNDPALEAPLIEYFPEALQERFNSEILHHRLRSEIICTVVTNELVNRLGPTFAFRMQQELGSSASDVAQAFIAVRQIFNMPKIWSDIESLDNKVSSDIQTQMHILVRGLIERATHWLLRSRRGYQTINQVVEQFQPGINELVAGMPDCLSSPSVETLNQRVEFFENAGVPKETAIAVAQVVPLSSSLDIVEVSRSLGDSVVDTAAVYFELGKALDLQWLREEISGLAVTSHWHVLAKAELRSDLHYQQRYLAAEVINSSDANQSANRRVVQWSKSNSHTLDKYTALMLEIKASSDVDFAMLSLAVKEVHKLLNSDRPLS